jgi:tRNA pseudouridine55 synthase
MRREPPTPVDEPRGGVLVLDKPPGPTSHDIVHVVRRSLRLKRVGHTGTLDPFATGVLPLVVGRATRLAQFYGSNEKTYLATIRLGWATDTYDGTGERTTDVTPDTALPGREAVEAALRTFAGAQDQVPPRYSAKKAGGTPAYEMARKGQAVTLPPVRVVAHELTVLGTGIGTVEVRVRCSAGYYVRSLAHDLGHALGVGAHLEALRRTRSGVFGLEDSVGLELVLTDPDAAFARVVPLDTLLPDWPSGTVTAQGMEWIGHGRMLGPEQFAGPVPDGPGDRVRLLAPDGQLLALGTRQPGGLLHPGLVLF